MAAQRTTARRIVFSGFALGLGLLGVADAARAGEERIFTDGFEPCCQIGGTLSGLTGSGLVLHLDVGAVNENLPISGNGLYQFAASVLTSTTYTVSVDTQPNGQTCTVANASGTMSSVNIYNVNVSCGVTPSLLWDQGNWGDKWQ